jgi:hypothetical protein
MRDVYARFAPRELQAELREVMVPRGRDPRLSLWPCGQEMTPDRAEQSGDKPVDKLWKTG